jgi:putative oxidoreductase
MSATGTAVLRVTIGVVFVIHGAHILFGVWGGPGVGAGGLSAASARFDVAGLSPGYAIAVLAGVIQLGAGLLLTVGLLTRWAAAALLLYVLVIAWAMHLPWGFFLNWTSAPGRGQGLEYSLVLAAALVCLMTGGGGPLSLEGRRASREASILAGRARALRRG